MKRMRRKNDLFLILILLLLGIGLGYALLTQNLTINGITMIKGNTWDIHFDNVQISSRSVSLSEGDSAAMVDANNNTLVNYTVSLNLPGDFYEFTVDAVNTGTVDGMVGEIINKLNGTIISDENSLPNYLSYSIAYSDGVTIAPNHLLKAGATETYKVRVEFKRSIENSELPTVDQNNTFSFGINYAQKNENAVEREMISPFVTSIDVASVQDKIVKYEINEEKCVEYYSNLDLEIMDLEAYCRGESVTDPTTGEIYDLNVQLMALTHDYYSIQNLKNRGVIIGEKYFDIKSYEIDTDSCISFTINSSGFSAEEAESFCTQEALDEYVSLGAGAILESYGILKNVVYEEVKPDVVIKGYTDDIPNNLVIPSSINGSKVIGIVDGTFFKKEISNLSLPNTIEYIGEKAFYGNNLTEVVIPNSVNTIGNRAFGQNHLNNVHVSNGNIAMGNCVFGNKEEITTNNLTEEYECNASCETGDVNYESKYQYTNGDYTYTYTLVCDSSAYGTFAACNNNIVYGWSVVLTDKDSTNPIIPELCSMVDDRPIIDMSNMFKNSKASYIDVSSLDTSKVIKMDGMFSANDATEIRGLNTLDTSNVRDMSSMFASTKLEELDISNFDTTKVIDMSGMFASKAIRKIYASNKFATDNVDYYKANNIFRGALNLIGGKGTVFTTGYESAIGMAVIDDGTRNGFFTDIKDKSQRVEDGNIIESCTGNCLKTDTRQGIPNADGLYQDDYGNYRYAGAEPYNYAEFNGEIWRIIGIFDGRIKLIRKSSLGDYSWDSNNGTNEWSNSALMRELNGDYLNTSLTENTNWESYPQTEPFDYTQVLNAASQQLIDNATWYLGGYYNHENEGASAAYRVERENHTCQLSGRIGCLKYEGSNEYDGVERTTSWIGKVGLIYPSDYAYASSRCKYNSFINNTGCNYLYNWLSGTGWGISPSIKSGSMVSVLYSSNNSSFDFYPVMTSFPVHPVVYLKPNVKVSGTGKNIDGERFTFSLQNN